MKSPDRYLVIIFNNVTEALLSEKILKAQDIPHKLIPVPRHISSDCGICLRLSPSDKDRIENALKGKVEINQIMEL